MKSWIAALLSALIVLPPLAAWAQEGRIAVDLNKLEQVDAACRAYLVFENGTGRTFSELKLDLVMFDQKGIVARRLLLDVAPLRVNKMILKWADIKDLKCAGIGRVLLNDVMGCVDEKGAHDDCVDLIDPSAKTQAPFVK